MIRLCNEAFLHRNSLNIQGNVYKRVGEELNIDEIESQKVRVKKSQGVTKVFADVYIQNEVDATYGV